MLAKLETPRVENVLLRQRLFKEIDKARNKPVTWISSPAGSGKTTLVASYLTDRNVSHLWYQLDEGDADPASFFYHLSQATSTFVQSSPALPLLTPEYLSGITVFARNFFRELFGQLTQPAVVVMDNYQDVPEKSMLHELLAAALMEVPKDIAIIIISRENPPATYARLQAHGDIQMLDWEQIKLARSESDDIAELRSGNVLNAKIAEDLYFKTNGWVTGLVLLLEHAERVPQTNVPTIGNHGLLFDYFAEEIFNSTDNQTQQFLLYTALLPKFSLKMADALVGKSGSTDIIKNLCSKNYFIIAHKGDPEKYEYHPLFRGFLKTLGLTRLSEVERVVLNESAINLLHACGETDTAILLAKETENWPALIQLITLHAANLVQDGRYSTLSEWLTHLPDQSLETNTWLRYWQAVTMIFTNPLAARVMLEAAYHNFIAEKNNIGSALVWSSIIDTYLVCWSEFKSLDPWLDVIILQAERIENSLPIEIQARFSSAIFIAFLYRKPADKNMSIWAEKVWKLFLNIDNSQLRLYLGPHLLMYYMWWIGDLAKAKTLLEPLSVQQKSAEPDPFHNLLLYAIEGGLSWMTAKNQQALESADQGLSLAENSGIHTWDIFIASQAAFGALSEHDLNKGVEYLELMKQRLITSRYVDSAWYDYIQGWYQYLLGQQATGTGLFTAITGIN